MKAYKVALRNEGGELISSLPDDVLFDCVEYEPGEWASPLKNCGPLCCFRNKKAAEKWKEKWENEKHHQEVWECEIIESTHKKVWKQYYSLFMKDWMVVETPIKDLPEGTVLADKVKLTRRIL